jgi:hypothetical protein
MVLRAEEINRHAEVHTEKFDNAEEFQKLFDKVKERVYYGR